MLPKRFKIGTARNNEWRCFFCFHVRTATIILGVWHLILHILALTVLALLMRNHNYVMQRHHYINNNNNNNEDFEQNNFLPTPLSKVKDDDNPYYLPTTQDGRPIYSSDIDANALVTVCTLAITLLMVYGAIKGKASHILPFFCLQVFDFALTALTATSYFCYLRSVHRLVSENLQNLPFKNDLLKLSPQSLSFILLVGFLIAMVWKAYCMGVVWRCWRYLNMGAHLPNTIHYILPHEGNDRVPEPDYSTLLREQEAAYGHLKLTPPPSYQDIMNEQPPPYIPASPTPSATRTTTTTRADVNNEPECASPVPSTSSASTEPVVYAEIEIASASNTPDVAATTATPATTTTPPTVNVAAAEATPDSIDDKVIKVNDNNNK